MALSKSRGAAEQQHYNHIFNHPLMQQRLQLIRNTYQLTMEEIAEICVVLGKTTLYNWETGTRIPAIDGLLVYTAKFGLSLDWLCGLYGTPYTDDSVTWAELKYFSPGRWKADHVDVSFLLNFNPISEQRFSETALRNYSNHETRQTVFSLEARANILVLLRYPNAISIASKRETSEEQKDSGENQKKWRKYIQVIDNLKTAINTGEAVYKLPNE